VFVLAFQNFKKDLSAVACSAIERELFTAHDPWVPHTSEVDAVLIAEVLAQHLIEDFSLAVDRSRLQNSLYGSVLLREEISAESSDATWQENPAIKVSCNPKTIDGAENIYVDCEVGVFLTSS
jgi:hypothetical protein